MAEIFGVSRTTIYTWLKRAIADGHLDESELTGRNRPRAGHGESLA
jgi:transposase